MALKTDPNQPEDGQFYENGLPKLGSTPVGNDFGFPTSQGGGILPEDSEGPGGITGKAQQGGYPAPISSSPYPNVGHDGSYNGQTREQWRDSWMGSGSMSQDQMKQKLTQMGATPTDKPDVWTTPYGETYDMGIGFKTGSPTAGWTPVGSGAGGSASPYGSMGGGAGAGGYGAGAGGYSGFGSGPMADAIQRLLSRGESTDYSTPAMKAASGAFRQAQDRATGRSRLALAERSAASGLNSGGAGSGAFDSAIQSQLESAGLNQANFDAKLTTDEITARRQDVVNALQFAQGEEKMRLTQMLAEMDNALQSRSLDLNNQHFYDQMGYQIGRDNQNYNMDYLRMAAGL